MKQYDFSICEFIDEKMWFFTYYDFCDNRKQIKREFDKLTRQQKKFYKYYVYANIHMNEMFKNRIWSYLNDYDEFGIELLKAKKIYKTK